VDIDLFKQITDITIPQNTLRLTISTGVSNSCLTPDVTKLIKETNQASYKAKTD